jgi:hypothetical protein
VPELTLSDGGTHTFLSRSTETEESGTSRLEAQLASLPAEAALRRVLVFRSADGLVSLNMFETESSSTFQSIQPDEPALRSPMMECA